MGRLLLGQQDRAVYRWERAALHPHDRSSLDEQTARAVVNHVWSDMGLLYPPKVTFKDIPDGGWGTRTELTFRPNPNHVILFHEMAHAMDTSLEVEAGEYGMRPQGESLSGSCHDQNFLGLYVNLLDRYMRTAAFNKLWLMKTLQDQGLSLSLAPKVRCI
jgi:hypothetical protein